MTSSASAPVPLIKPGAETPDAWATPVAGVHIGALDGIRGLAVLLVLVFHYGRSARSAGFQNYFLSASEFGWIGVDLFFVLSGFLITGILYDARGSGRYFRNFYARRSLRIFPLYFLALCVVLALAAWWPGAGVWPDLNPLWFVFYLSNVAMIAQTPHDAGILSHFWSLAIEEHFYLAWPAVVLLATRRQLIAIAVGVVVVSLFARLLLRLSGAASPDTLYFLTPFRLDALAVGAICSLAVRGRGGLAPLILPAWLAMLGGGAAVISIVLFTRSYAASTGLMQTLGYTCLAVAFGGLLLIALSFKPANHVFSNPLMRWFGRYSYGLYVWHPIINVILFYTPLKAAMGVEGAVGNIVYLLFAFLLVIVVGLASYHLFEQPFLRLKKRFSSNP
jgi:peptidoglycan/LPS O-acetylase OafA/YrhL